MIPMGTASLLAGLLAWIQQPAAPAQAEKLPLKLVYAGNANSPYTTAQLEFLEAHAASVKFVPGSKLAAADLKGADVLVIDGEVDTKNEKGEVRLKSEKIDLTLGEVQGMPIVAIGGEGGFFMDNLKLKLSWHHG